MRDNRADLCVEIKKVTQFIDDSRKVECLARVNFRDKPAQIQHGPDLDPTMGFSLRNRSAITFAIDLFDTGNCTRRQELDNPRPVVRRRKWE